MFGKVFEELRVVLRIAGVGLLLASLSLAACGTLDVLDRHAVTSDSCYCAADVFQNHTPKIGTGWKI